ncbi:hypothetical protein GGS23DRAFT_585366 [Durotheca rogersii]|uniref:uncharacterized protein n=1 Tax=Durotheca rogersii TaxID=419775 RepID=UPI00221F1042|nr:uncharacterized protein GGS23DRAFT_585366 [Durotheca rogersii]KAI5859424.1 hypothetical protein GGS23DRAFT_585366 [Durotheca rogersii]
MSTCPLGGFHLSLFPLSLPPLRRSVLSVSVNKFRHSPRTTAKMIFGTRLLLFAALQIRGRAAGAALIIPSATAPSTPESAPVPTPPPLAGLEARDRAAGLCGYYNGDRAVPFICNAGYACVGDSTWNAVGCVSMGPQGQLLGVVPTYCIDYSGYTAGMCNNMGSRTGCCYDPNFPACIGNTYTGSKFEGYTAFRCGASYLNQGYLLAWEASTSGVSATTVLIALAGTNVPASPDTAEAADGGGLSTSDKIALGVSLPGTIAGILGAWYAYKAIKRRRANAARPDSQVLLT